MIWSLICVIPHAPVNECSWVETEMGDFRRRSVLFIVSSSRCLCRFTVELCEPIQVKQLDIANFEIFSSNPRDFLVSISDRSALLQTASLLMDLFCYFSLTFHFFLKMFCNAIFVVYYFFKSVFCWQAAHLFVCVFITCLFSGIQTKSGWSSGRFMREMSGWCRVFLWMSICLPNTSR